MSNVEKTGKYGPTIIHKITEDQSYDQEDEELVESNGVERSSICTYNGVEYRSEVITIPIKINMIDIINLIIITMIFDNREREEVFTGRRCSKCRCYNGEIRFLFELYLNLYTRFGIFYLVVQEIHTLIEIASLSFVFVSLQSFLMPGV